MLFELLRIMPISLYFFAASCSWPWFLEAGNRHIIYNWTQLWISSTLYACYCLYLEFPFLHSAERDNKPTATPSIRRLPPPLGTSESIRAFITLCLSYTQNFSLARKWFYLFIYLFLLLLLIALLHTIFKVRNIICTHENQRSDKGICVTRLNHSGE